MLLNAALNIMLDYAKSFFEYSHQLYLDGWEFLHGINLCTRNVTNVLMVTGLSIYRFGRRSSGRLYIPLYMIRVKKESVGHCSRVPLLIIEYLCYVSV